MQSERARRTVEWPTLAMMVLCYGLWFLCVFWLAPTSLWVGIPLLATAIALQASLAHEVIHGHPFRNQSLNAALVWPVLNLVVPYGRFRDTHLAHHQDANLTDPYDDPESNYLDPLIWQSLRPWQRSVLRFNNTLLGRITIGPLIGQVFWLRSDLRSIAGDGEASGQMRRDWAIYLMSVVSVLLVVSVSAMPIWSYLVAAYLSLSLIRIRTYLEHRAHERASARTAIVESRGVLSLLFLNNNLHVVHHMHPDVPWYDLPRLYEARKAHYQARNGGYVYRSYGQIFRAYFLKPKDTVPHPLMSGKPE